MKNTQKMMIAAGAATALLSVAAVSYAAGSDGAMNGNGRGNGQSGQSGQMAGQRGPGNTTNTTTTTTTSSGSIDQTTQDALLHMVEEEKLAHDVYVTLGIETDLSIFDRISASESQHESVLRTLLDRYDLSDPTAGNDVGEFTDPAFTALYEQLVEDGSESDLAALQVGVTIEEMDIDDLATRTDQTTATDVIQVFDRLTAGSERHLNAFERTIDTLS